MKYKISIKKCLLFLIINFAILTKSYCLTYTQKAKSAKHPMATELLLLMDDKKTNLAVAADVTTKAKLLKLVEEVGPYICILKTHIDIIKDFDEDLIEQLRALSEKHKFLIFEDRKFCDIVNTVEDQYAGGIYKISKWANIISAHAISGPGIISILQTFEPRNGLLLVAQMSSNDNLFPESYTKAVVKMAEEYRDHIIGFIAQQKVSEFPGFIHMTPGINVDEKSDGKDQTYNSPHSAIVERGSDVIIVGRAIYNASDPAAAAQKYRDLGWTAYQERIKR